MRVDARPLPDTCRDARPLPLSAVAEFGFGVLQFVIAITIAGVLPAKQSSITAATFVAAL